MTASVQRPYSILITDDDRGSRESLRDIVEPQGYHTLLASSGEEALEIVRHEPVHVVLTDMHMPRLTGLEAMQLVRQFKAELPAILLSADSDDSLMRQALSAKVYCVLAKPVQKNVVIYVVTRALKKFYPTTRDAG